jgi:hypothetical protein
MKLSSGRRASKSNDQRLHEVHAFLKHVKAHDAGASPRVREKVRTSLIFSRAVSLRNIAGFLMIAGGVLTVFAAGPGFQSSRGEYSAGLQTSHALNISSIGGENLAVIELSPEAVILSAQRLMDTGHVIEARRSLSRRDVVATVDGSWRLARSYDPNYLASIPSPDALADKALASEWYRRWRDIGAHNGLEMDDIRLKRLIDSMR